MRIPQNNARQKSNLIVVTVLAMGIASCKRISSDLSDSAGAQSFKTGIFAPQSVRQRKLTVAPIRRSRSPNDFLEDCKKILGNRNLEFRQLRNAHYRLIEKEDGEEILVQQIIDDVPLPLLSLTPEKKIFTWSQYLINQTNTNYLTDLFIKIPYGQRNSSETTIEDMYIRRMAFNNQRFYEPVLVPWKRHIRSELADLTLFRIGNSFLFAGTGKVAFEYRELVADQVWILAGEYDDGEVRAGTIIFRGSEANTYLSIHPGQRDVTIWKRQDEDSLDRIGTKNREEIGIDSKIISYLNTSSSRPTQTLSNAEGFDWIEGDREVIQLDIKPNAASNARSLPLSQNEGGLFLSGQPQVASKKWGRWWEGEKTPNPVTVTQRGNAGSPQGVQFTDQNGQNHSGAVLATRRDNQGKIVYSVWNRTANEVREVHESGRVTGAVISIDDYIARAQGTINRMNTMRDNGELRRSDERAQRSANELDQRSKRQLERINSILPGNTSGEIVANVFKGAAVTSIALEANALIPGSSTVLGQAVRTSVAKESARIVAGGLPTRQEGVINHGNAVLVDMTKFTTGGAIGTALPTPLGKNQAMVGAVTVVDTAADALRRNAQGDFSSSNPDVVFDRSISLPAVAGTAVADTAAGMVYMKARNSNTAFVAAGTTVNTLFNSAESASRGSYATGLSEKAGEILDQRIEMKQRENSYREGLKTIEKLSGN